MPGLPTGMVTFLFTDIEESTKLLQRLGDDHYAIVLTECQQLLRASFKKWDGYEVDTQGDSFFVAFARAENALAASVEAQRLLTEHSWPEGVVLRVRMGLHSGKALVNAESYVGLDVHRAARIMSAGHGGQVLLSQSTLEFVQWALPSGVSLRDLGEYHLKDLQFPEHLTQLLISNLPNDFPALRTPDMYLHKMPSLLPSQSGGVSHSQETPASASRPPPNLIYAVRWSANKRHIAACGHDPTVHVWKSTTAEPEFSYRSHKGAVINLAWSPDGTRIASASLDKTIQVWLALPDENPDIKRKLSEYDGHASLIYALAWSPDGKSIVSSSGGSTNSKLRIWNADTGADLVSYTGHTTWARAVAWSPNGQLIASGSLKEVQVWNAVTGRKVQVYHGHQGWVKALAWSPDGKYIASTGEDKTVQVWAKGTGRVFGAYRDHTAWVSVVEWSPDGKYIVSLDRDNIAHAWEAATGKCSATFSLLPDTVYALTWLPDGKHVAFASGDRAVKVWRAR